MVLLAVRILLAGVSAKFSTNARKVNLVTPLASISLAVVLLLQLLMHCMMSHLEQYPR